jgi:hypothetical protein
MKPKVLLIYKDENDFNELLKCIKNRYGRIVRKNKQELVEMEHIIFNCIRVNDGSQNMRGRKYDFLYISDLSNHIMNLEFREYCKYCNYDVTMFRFSSGAIDG